MDRLFAKSLGKVKEESRVMYETCVKRARSIGHTEYVRTGGKVALENTFKTDLLNFLVYLAYSDGYATKEEIKYINSLMGLEFSDKQFSDYANAWELKGESIMERAPVSLEHFVRSNIGPETGEISNSYYDIVTLYVTSFNYIGNDLISCNDDVKSGEIEALTSYINMLREKIEDVKEKIVDYKPTIAFKPGSKIKQEERVEYSYDELPPEELFGENSIDKESDGQSEKLEKPDKLDKLEKTTSDIVNQEDDLEALMKELNDLIGMESVKQEINNLVNLLKICKIREQKGLKLPPTTNHLVFLGNPGTGKTTVARILSKIYHGLGVLSKGHLVEVDRSGLVAGYMGQTGEKVMEVVNEAKGGVLFIDEAYALSSNKQEGDFGQEAVDILNKAMEDYRDDLIVIAAGYHNEMQDFLDANPGLRSRFNRTIEFPNYDADELLVIIENRAKKLDYNFDDDAKEFVRNKFKKVLANPPKNFGNARSARNFLENAINNQANRLVKESTFDEAGLTTIKLEDVMDLEFS